MVRSELELKIAQVTGAEVRNGRWYLAGRDFTLAMEGIVVQIEREVADTIEPLIDAYTATNSIDTRHRKALQAEWSALSRPLEELTTLYKELS